MLYLMLKSVSTAIYTTVTTIWHIEEALINFMMSCFLLLLGLLCHPLMVLPMLLGGAYILHKMWLRRKATAAAETGARLKAMRTPRLRSYRLNGSLSSRSSLSRASAMDMSDEERVAH